MKPVLLIFILLYCLHSSAQSITELQDSSIYYTGWGGKAKKTRVMRKSDSSLLSAGQYKSVAGDRYRLFEVNDSGYLDGSFKDFFNERNYLERIYDKGLQIREYYKAGDKILSESFDSSVSVLLYNSKKNRWAPQLKTVTVEKEYDPSGYLSILRFSKGPYDSYATYRYRRGVLISEIIPWYQEKKMDPSGNVYNNIFYNWALKQIETSEYEKGILKQKIILKNPRTVWDPQGIVRMNDIGLYDDVVSCHYFDGKKIRKKEVVKNRKRTVTEYDLQGKVISVNTYPLANILTETGVQPIEVKQQ